MGSFETKSAGLGVKHSRFRVLRTRSSEIEKLLKRVWKKDFSESCFLFQLSLMKIWFEKNLDILSFLSFSTLTHEMYI